MSLQSPAPGTLEAANGALWQCLLQLEKRQSCSRGAAKSQKGQASSDSTDPMKAGWGAAACGDSLQLPGSPWIAATESTCLESSGNLFSVKKRERQSIFSPLTPISERSGQNQSPSRAHLSPGHCDTAEATCFGGSTGQGRHQGTGHGTKGAAGKARGVRGPSAVPVPGLTAAPLSVPGAAAE